MERPYNCNNRVKLSILLVRLFVLTQRGHTKMKYDFDYLKNLYKEDQAKFEKITKAMIDDVIDGASEENKKIYRAKQWRLEQELGKVKDPLERMNRMVSIFWSGVNEFVAATKNFKYQEPQPQQTNPCQVIDIKRKIN